MTDSSRKHVNERHNMLSTLTRVEKQSKIQL